MTNPLLPLLHKSFSSQTNYAQSQYIYGTVSIEIHAWWIGTNGYISGRKSHRSKQVLWKGLRKCKPSICWILYCVNLGAITIQLFIFLATKANRVLPIYSPAIETNMIVISFFQLWATYYTFWVAFTSPYTPSRRNLSHPIHLIPCLTTVLFFAVQKEKLQWDYCWYCLFLNKVGDRSVCGTTCTSLSWDRSSDASWSCILQMRIIHSVIDLHSACKACRRI